MIKVSQFLGADTRLAADLDLVFAGAPQESGDSTFDLSQVPVDRATIEPRSRLVVHLDPRNPGADRFRYLRMRLRELSSMRPLRRLLVTSPLPGDGKSTVALNIATSLADSGKHAVLLIEGDLYQPAIGGLLGLPVHPGLAEILQDNLPPLSAIRRIDPLQLYFLPAGTPRGSPGELLQPDLLAAAMRTINTLFEWIVIDSPPLTPLSDAILLSRHVDACLLVARAGQTPKKGIEEALEALGPTNVAAVILNGEEEVNRLYSQYNGYYQAK